MSLELDERQRRMLEEFGIRTFGPDAKLLDEVTDCTPPNPPRQAVAAVVDRNHLVADVGTPPNPRRQAGGTASLQDAGTLPRSVPLQQVAPQLAPRPEGVEVMAWEELQQAVASCRACGLCEGRRNTVFGVGDVKAEWLVVGEAPGENEDLQGEPFVGQAGKLLDNMLKSMGLNRRDKVYIANVLKCRPPNNRNPEPHEVAQCEPFLRRQVQLLQPRIILAMGRFAVQTLLGSTEPIGRLRGRVHRYMDVPVVVTYHPAYLLRSLPEKSKAWADLCLAMQVMRGEA